MKAVFCEKLGGPEALVVREIDPPGAPASGQLKVALRARGLSFPDVLMVSGGYHVKPPLPFVLGHEAAGEIIAVGDSDAVNGTHNIDAPLKNQRLNEETHIDSSVVQWTRIQRRRTNVRRWKRCEGG